MSVNIFNAATQEVKKIAGNSTGVWSGTTQEYETQKHNIPDGTIVVFTDDYSSEICSTVEECVASTSPNDIAGASAVAEINGNLAQLPKVKGFRKTITAVANGNGAFDIDLTSMHLTRLPAVVASQNMSAITVTGTSGYMNSCRIYYKNSGASISSEFSVLVIEPTE